MKYFFVFILGMWSLSGVAQKATVKLYGYAQPVIGGVPSIQHPDEKEKYFKF